MEALTLRAGPGSFPPGIQLRAWHPVDAGIVFVSHKEASSHNWTHSAYVVYLMFKENWGGKALLLGPLLVSDLRKEGREGPGTWGDRPHLFL